MMIQRFLGFFILITFVYVPVWSQEGTGAKQIDEARELEISQRAKKRNYPGGRDEEDLKVQSQVAKPVRKVAPQAEVKEEPVEE